MTVLSLPQHTFKKQNINWQYYELILQQETTKDVMARLSGSQGQRSTNSNSYMWIGFDFLDIEANVDRQDVQIDGHNQNVTTAIQ